jgi:hypothetical protein
VSNLNAKPPFSAWGYGERHRCDFCGNFQSLPGSPVVPQHKPDCSWGIKDLRKRKAAARKLLGLNAQDVKEALARKANK